MNLDEAKAVIDRAWNSGPKSIDWNDVEEASMVIAAETGSIYVPPEDEMAPWPRREAPRAPVASSRGTKSGYDAGARRGEGKVRPSAPVHRSVRGSIPREHSVRDLLEQDEKPPGWP